MRKRREKEGWSCCGGKRLQVGRREGSECWECRRKKNGSDRRENQTGREMVDGAKEEVKGGRRGSRG